MRRTPVVPYSLLVSLLGLSLLAGGSAAQGSDPCSFAQDSLGHRRIPYSWHLRPARPSQWDPITFVITTCRECVDLDAASYSFGIVARARMPETCPEEVGCTPDSVEVRLGKLCAGAQSFALRWYITVQSADSTSCLLYHRDAVAFEVHDAPAPALPEPYIEVGVGMPRYWCPACVPNICPGQPIGLHLSGTFSDCGWKFRGLELVPAEIARNHVEPDLVRLRFEHRPPMGSGTWDPCGWRADTVLAPLPGGRDYDLVIRVDVDDVTENATPGCPLAYRDTTYIETRTFTVPRVCAKGSSCDVNRDGSLDARDLVAMVQCILGRGPCPDSTRVGLDCNHDGRWSVEDVLCCSRSILRWRRESTTSTRGEPGVAVRIAEPEWRGEELSVPLALDGADRVGAARLALALPLDRFDVTGVEVGEGASQWLELHEVVDGRLVLGLIGLAPAGTAPARLPLSITLALKPGRDAGGDLALADAQFSGPDGVTLVTPQAQPVVPLPSPGALRLAAPRPNPFTTRTQFSLALARAAEVEISVHDLSGRRVATLQRGPLGAGPHEYAWTGARDDGSVAPDGIYFVHARVGGERLAQKVVFLRGR